jgi:hypothetical protein
MKISKSTLGLAAEYAVASELCRRNVTCYTRRNGKPLGIEELPRTGKGLPTF